MNFQLSYLELPLAHSTWPLELYVAKYFGPSAFVLQIRLPISK